MRKNSRKKKDEKLWMLAVQTKECKNETYDLAKIYMFHSKEDRHAMLYGLLEANKDAKWMFIDKVDN